MSELNNTDQQRKERSNNSYCTRLWSPFLLDLKHFWKKTQLYLSKKIRLWLSVALTSFENFFKQHKFWMKLPRKHISQLWRNREGLWFSESIFIRNRCSYLILFSQPNTVIIEHISKKYPFKKCITEEKNTLYEDWLKSKKVPPNAFLLLRCVTPFTTKYPRIRRGPGKIVSHAIACYKYWRETQSDNRLRRNACLHLSKYFRNGFAKQRYMKQHWAS